MSKPLVAIVGPTASGKSELAMQVAREHQGEIICADSRTIYKGLDIGTAKPSAADQEEVKHHLIDLITPDQRYSAAEFQQAAKSTINDINDRGKLPILVGGTGLYIDAVLYDFVFPGNSDNGSRGSLEKLDLAELQSTVDSLDVSLNPSDYRNRPRLIRAIETAGQERTKHPLRANTLVVGLDADTDELRRRIHLRVESMINAGLVGEVKGLLSRYKADAPGLSAPAYRAFRDQIQGRASLSEAIKRFESADGQLAKRQRTWFKRNPDISWFDNPDAAQAAIEAFVAKAV